MPGLNRHYRGEPVDIWAMGVLLFFMLTGYTPFRGETVAELKNLICVGEFTFPDCVSEVARDLISGILNIHPGKRFTITSIKVRFQFFS